MKKTLSVLLAVCLVFAMCIPAFAKSVDAGKKSAVSARAREVIAELNAEPTTDEEGNEVEKISTTEEAAKAIFDAIKKAGASNAAEANDAADQLYNNGDFAYNNDKEFESEIYKLVKAEAAKDGAFDDAEPSDSDIIAKITAIFNDDSLSITDKISKAVQELVGLPIEQVENILNTLHNNGTIDDNTYNQISDALNNASISNLPSLDGLNIDGSSLGGIGDLLSGLLGMLGLGGGDSGDGSGSGSSSGSGSGSSSSGSGSKGSSSSFEGKTAKTGDYAVASIAGVAALAGVAFVLTRKKTED